MKIIILVLSLAIASNCYAWPKKKPRRQYTPEEMALIMGNLPKAQAVQVPYYQMNVPQAPVPVIPPTVYCTSMVNGNLVTTVCQ